MVQTVFTPTHERRLQTLEKMVREALVGVSPSGVGLTYTPDGRVILPGGAQVGPAGLVAGSPPPAPSSLVLTAGADAGDVYVDVDWTPGATTAAGPVTAWAVEVLRDGDTLPIVLHPTADLAPPNQAYRVHYLDPNTLYHFAVRAITQLGASSVTLTGDETTGYDTAAPAQVTGLVASAALKSITASWTALGSTLAPFTGKYLVDVATNNTFTTGLKTYDNADSNVFSVVGLTTGQNYYLRVTSRSSSGVNGTVSATVGPITPGQAQSADLADLAVTLAKLADASVSTAKLVDAAVTSVKVDTAAITTTKIADNSVTTPKVVAGAITANEIAANTITAAKIAAGTITAAEIAAATITAAKIAAGTITAAQISTNTITAAQIAAGTITATEIAAATITASKLVAGTITATSGVIGSIDATKITVNQMDVARLGAGTIGAYLIQLASGGTIRSANYVAGTSGWNIDGAGNAELNNVTVRGVLAAAAFASTDFTFRDSGGQQMLRLLHSGTSHWLQLGDGINVGAGLRWDTTLARYIFEAGTANSPAFTFASAVNVGGALLADGSIAFGGSAYTGGVFANDGSGNIESNWGLAVDSNAGAGIYTTAVRYHAGGGAGNRRGGVFENSGLYGWMFYGAQDGNCYSRTSWSVFSSKSLKKNIKPLAASDVDPIMALRPVRYRLKVGDEARIADRFGLIGEEVAAAMPELANKTGDLTAVDYTSLVVPLLAKVQDQERRLTALEGKAK